MSENILVATEIKKYFYSTPTLMERIRKIEPFKIPAVDGVSLQIKAGETVGLVGESGCGKSTFGRSLVGLYDLTEGEIEIQGEKIGKNRTLEQRRAIQMIFQDPFSSLNPQMTVGEMLKEILLLHKLEEKQTVEKAMRELMSLVGLPISALNSHPRQFSGGQRQRIGISRALAMNPKILIADEAVSALDVSVQATIINLLLDLKRDLGLTILFISHNIAVVRQMCDRIAVMYMGRIVEIGPTEEIFTKPKHPYTKLLLSAVPKMTPGIKLKPSDNKSEVPLEFKSGGCRFRDRCKVAIDNCATQDPELKGDSHHQAACLISE